MHRHIDCALVQERSCGVLCHLTRLAENYSVVVFIVGFEAIEHVVSAMRRHADKEGVQVRGCGTLRNLTCGDVVQGTVAGNTGRRCRSSGGGNFRAHIEREVAAQGIPGVM
jgi:hypothetical protein